MDEITRQDKERALWDEIAEKYDRNSFAIYQKAYDDGLALVREHIDSSNNLLEIGCGTAIMTLGLAGDAGRSVGVDISEKMIEVARHKAADLGLDDVEFHVCDGYTIPFEDASFDRVLVFNVLHVVNDPTAILSEAYRLLKPGGLLFSATDCYGDNATLRDRVLIAFEWVLKQVGKVNFVSFFKRTDVDTLHARTGFAILESRILHPSPINYYILAEKPAPSQPTE